MHGIPCSATMWMPPAQGACQPSTLGATPFACLRERLGSLACSEPLALTRQVLDLKAWLPQHPGGATIIPQQGLNRDCTVFFELYHASRESFMYLREFYVGELWPSELSKVPHHDERASDDFMAQLRDFSSAFRINAPTFEASAMKAKVHLGA